MRERLVALLEGERYVLCCVLILMMVNLTGGLTFSRGYDASITLVTMQTCALMWAFGVGMRLTFPDVAGLYVFEFFALTTFIGIQATLATAAVAPYGGAYADNFLASLDAVILPFVSWPDTINWLIAHPDLFEAANYIYTSVRWQAPFLLLVLAITGRIKLLRALAVSSGVSSVIGLIVFSFVPARGAYLHHGYTQADLPNLKVGLPFEFPVVLERLRNGTVDVLSGDVISGLISFPSFHACGAMILALAWSRIPYFRWPMIALNVGVAIAAVPIGSHYFSDIAAGVALGVFSFRLGEKLIGLHHRPNIPLRDHEIPQACSRGGTLSHQQHVLQHLHAGPHKPASTDKAAFCKRMAA